MSYERMRKETQTATCACGTMKWMIGIGHATVTVILPSTAIIAKANIILNTVLTTSSSPSGKEMESGQITAWFQTEKLYTILLTQNTFISICKKLGYKC